MFDWLQTPLFGYAQFFLVVYFVDIFRKKIFLFSLVSANYILPTLSFRKLSHILLKLWKYIWLQFLTQPNFSSLLPI